MTANNPLIRKHPITRMVLFAITLPACSTLPVERFDYHELDTVTREQVQAVYDSCLESAYKQSGEYIKTGLLTGGLHGFLAGTVVGQSTVRNHQVSCMYENGFLDYGE